MNTFKRISTHDAKALFDDGSATLADVRDQHSYLSSHIENAFHLHNDNIEEFVAQSTLDQPLVVYCYHGNSSQGAAQFLLEKGFSEVYSMDGGFEEWRTQYATTTDSTDPKT